MMMMPVVEAVRANETKSEKLIPLYLVRDFLGGSREEQDAALLASMKAYEIDLKIANNVRAIKEIERNAGIPTKHGLLCYAVRR